MRAQAAGACRGCERGEGIAGSAGAIDSSRRCVLSGACGGRVCASTPPFSSPGRVTWASGEIEEPRPWQGSRAESPPRKPSESPPARRVTHVLPHPADLCCAGTAGNCWRCSWRWRLRSLRPEKWMAGSWLMPMPCHAVTPSGRERPQRSRPRHESTMQLHARRAVGASPMLALREGAEEGQRAGGWVELQAADLGQQGGWRQGRECRQHWHRRSTDDVQTSEICGQRRQTQPSPLVLAHLASCAGAGAASPKRYQHAILSSAQQRRPPAHSYPTSWDQLSQIRRDPPLSVPSQSPTAAGSPSLRKKGLLLRRFPALGNEPPRSANEPSRC